MQEQEPAARLKHTIWIGFTTFFAYTGAYTARNILSAVMPQMLQERIFTNAELGSMGSMFFLLYGLGQLINGLLGDKIIAKYMVAAGLFFSGVLTALFPLCGVQSAFASLALWGVCGFLCSMLWGPITKLVGENTDARAGKIILTVLSVASHFGTAAAYIFAVLGVSARNWRFGFYLTGGFLMLAATVWYVSCSRMERAGAVKRGIAPKEGSARQEVGFRRLFTRGFVFMMIVTMLNGVARIAIAFWIPVFLSNRLGIKIEHVAALAFALPFLNMLGVFLTLYALKFMRDHLEKMCLLLFAVAAVMFAALFALDGTNVILSVAALFTASAAMAGVSNIIFSLYILRFSDTNKLSGIAGFLDFT
ncbi:MAG: MFS transporter, partial [Clostridiales bacterium]|nr:MFS transporter [Clostridiales bacterium]